MSYLGDWKSYKRSPAHPKRSWWEAPWPTPYPRSHSCTIPLVGPGILLCLPPWGQHFFFNSSSNSDRPPKKHWHPLIYQGLPHLHLSIAHVAHYSWLQHQPSTFQDQYHHPHYCWLVLLISYSPTPTFPLQPSIWNPYYAATSPTSFLCGAHT